MNAQRLGWWLLAAAIMAVPDAVGSQEITDSVELARSLVVRSTADGDIVLLEGATTAAESGTPGHPDLPILKLRYVLPTGMRVASVSATATETDTLDGSYEPIPLPNADGSAADPDPLVYDSGSAYPSDHISRGLSGALRGFRIVSVVLKPVQYVGETGTLIHHRSFDVSLDLTPESESARRLVRERQRSGRRLSRSGAELTWLRDHVRNPSDIEAFYLLEPEHLRAGTPDTTAFGGFTPSEAPSLDGPPVDYVIVCDEDMADAFQALADWKTEKGVPAVVRTTQWIDDRYTEADRPERIRAFVIDAYELWGTDWVLLGGDHEQVPTRFLWGGGVQQGPGQGPSDVYYAGLDGDWNVMADYQYGSSTSDIETADPYYDVWVGRVPIDSASEATDYVEKVLSYVRAPSVVDEGPGEAFYTRVVAFAGMTNSSFWTNEHPQFTVANGLWKSVHLAQDLLLPRAFNPALHLEDVWDASICDDCFGTSRDTLKILSDSTWVSEWRHSDLMQDLNAGANLVYHSEHSAPYGQGGASACAGSGCTQAAGACTSSGCTDDLEAVNLANQSFGLETYDVDALTNGDGAYSIVYGTGSYANAGDFRSVSEHWVRNPNGGAVAYVGFNRSSSANSVAYADTTFYHVLIEDGVDQIGQTLANTMALGWDGQGPYIRAATSFNLLGDPELTVWTAVPDTFDTPSYGPSSVTALGPQTITVTLEHESATVTGARVCLKQSDVGYAIATTNASGVATFYDFDVGSTEDILVTATKRNFVPVRDTLDVSDSPDAWVRYDRHVYSELAGNGNSRVEAGEDIELQVTLENEGSATGDPLVARLFVNEPFTITTIAHDTNFPFALGENEAPMPGTSLDLPAHQEGLLLFGEPSGVGSSAGVYIWRDLADSLRWNIVTTAPAGSARPAKPGARVPHDTIVKLQLDAPAGYPGFRAIESLGLEGLDAVNTPSSTKLIVTLVNHSTAMTADHDTVRFMMDEAEWITASTAVDTLLAGIGAGSAGTIGFEVELSPEIPDGHDAWLTVAAEVDEAFVGISDFSLPIGAPVLELRRQTTGSCFGIGCTSLKPVIHNTGSGDADSLVLRITSTDPDISITVGETTHAGLAAGAEAEITGIQFAPVGGAGLDELTFDFTVTNVFDRSTSDTLRVSYPDMDFIAPGDIGDVRAYAFAPQSVTVRWDTLAVTGEVDTSYVGYNVYRKTGGGSFTRINDAPISGVSHYVDDGLADGTQYVYRVTAVDEDGNEGGTADAASYTWPPFAEGWPQRIEAGTESSALVFNIDDDDTTEVFLASDKIYAWNADGSPYESDDGVFFEAPGDTVFIAALAGGDLDADGTYELVATTLDSLYVIEHDGSLRSGFPKYVNALHCAPTVANLDGDANDYLEIVAPSADTLLYAWDKDGNTFLSGQSTDGRFAKVKGRYNYGGVSVADLDGNGDLEVIHASGTEPWLEVFKPTDGGDAGADADSLWSHYLGNHIVHRRLWKPAVGEIGGFGDANDIALVQDGEGASDAKIIAFESDGTVIDSIRIAGQVGSNLASGPPMTLADLDDDDELEIIYGKADYSTSSGDSVGYELIVIDTNLGHFDNPDPVTCSVWVQKPFVKRGTATELIGGAVVADVDGDSVQEIMVGTHDFTLHAFEWTGGDEPACVPDERMPLLVHHGEVWATPQIGDFDDDDKLELLVSDMGGRVVIYDLPGGAGSGTVQWARYGNDIGNTGRYDPTGGARLTPQAALPMATRLRQNRPNPFNPRTTIGYDVGEAGPITIRVYDVGGREIATLVDRFHASGSYHVLWDGTDDVGRRLSSGVYFYELQSEAGRHARKLLLLK